MNQHFFFQQFFGPGGPGMPPGMAPEMQAPPPVPEYIIHNETVLEMANNWPFVRWMMDRHRRGELKQVDQMEQQWLNFIMTKNIDIEFYKNNEEFIQANRMKVPEN